MQEKYKIINGIINENLNKFNYNNEIKSYNKLKDENQSIFSRKSLAKSSKNKHYKKYIIIVQEINKKREIIDNESSYT